MTATPGMLGAIGTIVGPDPMGYYDHTVMMDRAWPDLGPDATGGLDHEWYFNDNQLAPFPDDVGETDSTQFVRDVTRPNPSVLPRRVDEPITLPGFGKQIPDCA